MKHIRVADLRIINGKLLKEMTEPEVIWHWKEPVAVMVPYELFMKWQEIMEAKNGRNDK